MSNFNGICGTLNEEFIKADRKKIKKEVQNEVKDIEDRLRELREDGATDNEFIITLIVGLKKVVLRSFRKPLEGSMTVDKLPARPKKLCKALEEAEKDALI